MPEITSCQDIYVVVGLIVKKNAHDHINLKFFTIAV